MRYLLWLKASPREQWDTWLSLHAGLDLWTARCLTTGRSAPANSIDDAQLTRIAAALEHAGTVHALTVTDLATQRADVLVENLRYLLEIERRGGKRRLCARLGINPTTLSRWLSGEAGPRTQALF